MRPTFFLLLPAVLCLAGPAAAKDIPDSDVVAWVEKSVEERQPPAKDKRFNEIGWARDVRGAIELGKKHNRPIFLFTMDGRISTGRC